MAQKRFGTFSGVFLPNILTIFGVILFYREGWLVGNTGLLGAVLIILIANLITIATALSLSAIVTNIKVKGGGAYYLVSRSLGPEIGGAIGISLFFAQTFSISFYIIGFTKALAFLPPFQGISLPLLNMTTLLFLTLLSIFSAEAAIKAQYFIFLLVMGAIFSFIFGNLNFTHSPELFGPFSDGGFWKSFAIFFPAATGIFAGLSLSGDLKEPDRSLPKGTLLAIGFTLVVYLMIAAVFSFSFKQEVLLSSDTLMQDSALVPVLVLLGIFAATISSAIGVLLGAPRTLQALARDGIVPGFLGKGSGPADEPRVAMVLSVLLSSTLLYGGGIDFVSQLLTMFFLASYGIVNFIAAIEVVIGNPAFRPKFRVHWLISLCGASGSFMIMFMIDQLATVIALVIIISIYFFYTRKNLRKNWGDIRKGFWATVIEIGLSNYHKYEQHPRNFRPYIAILENEKTSRAPLVEFASLLSGKTGIVSAYVFQKGSLSQAELAEQELAGFKQYLQEKCTGFVSPEVVSIAKDKNAHLTALQADGIGDFKSNTIVSDFYIDNRSLEEHFRYLSEYLALGKNIILLKKRPEGHVFDDRVDIWLSGFKANISILLLIPFLLSRNPDWATARLCLRMVVSTLQLKEQAEKNINAILGHARINAAVSVLCLEEGGEEESSTTLDVAVSVSKQQGSVFSRLVGFFKTFETGKYNPGDRERISAIIKQTSADARLVVLGLHLPEKSKINAYAASVRDLTASLPLTILVKGNQEINLFK